MNNFPGSSKSLMMEVTLSNEVLVGVERSLTESTISLLSRGTSVDWPRRWREESRIAVSEDAVDRACRSH